jgi:acylphosphatase
MNPMPRTDDPADLHVIVQGRVQGVGFRESLIAEAQALGVAGWVRNCADGTVEAVLRGPAAAREELLRWARRGPPAARVDHVESRPARTGESALVGNGFRRLPSR